MKRLREQDFVLEEDEVKFVLKNDRFYKMMRDEKFKRKREWN